jgi:hypothetical protein
MITGDDSGIIKVRLTEDTVTFQIHDWCSLVTGFEFETSRQEMNCIETLLSITYSFVLMIFEFKWTAARC